MHDRVVGDARAERVVLGPIGGRGLTALLLLVGAAASLLAGSARGGGRRPHGVAADAASAGLLGELLELVGGLIDRLEMALMLVLSAGRSDVGVPALGHPAARELDFTGVERRLELQQEHRLFNIEDPRHRASTLAARATPESGL